MAKPQQSPWEPQPQETSGTYRFDGKFHATTTVDTDIGREAVMEIYLITQRLVRENNGIDYILAFKQKETGVVVWMIDQLNDEMKAAYSGVTDPPIPAH
jgi:hypothetical protein